jgi:hypothetical protein
MTDAPRRVLHPGAAMRARIVRRLPMRYAAGADPAQDRPPHVRAGSALARVGDRLAVVQDDANFVALVDPATGLARPVALPRGAAGLRQFDEGRGNKRFKMDLEACAAVPDVDDPGRTMLLALGSGSAERRERVVLLRGLDGPGPEVRVVDAPALYERLRARRDFSGSQMNVEGAVVIGERLRLFARGNGAPKDGVLPVNATCDLDLARLLAYLRDPASANPPDPADVVQYDLGEIGGERLGFTDAALVAGRVWFSAAAEDSPDAYHDGPVAGSALGVLDEGGGRWTELVDEEGRRFAGKVEGLLPRGETSAWVVVDADDPDRPSELCEVELEGFG